MGPGHLRAGKALLGQRHGRGRHHACDTRPLQAFAQRGGSRGAGREHKHVVGVLSPLDSLGHALHEGLGLSRARAADQGGL